MNFYRSNEVIESLSTFFRRPIENILQGRLAINSQENVIKLFRATAAEVPAYQQFLADHGIDAKKIRTFADFQRLPLVNKANFMLVYPLPQRCKGGKLTSCDRIAVSSGSTGKPTFWPRTMVNELDVAFRFEQVFRHSFKAHERDTLAIVCFPLGNWVGGMFTASCCWHLAEKGYPLTVSTPGNKVDEILKVVLELGCYFQQTVLLGYPPFVKDVIDAGLRQGIDWTSYGVKYVFAGEVFSEEWRSMMIKTVGASSACYDSASLYGTADGGVLGNETPLSITIRRFLADTPTAARELFGESRLPTLVQYDPMSRFLEIVENGTLAVSGDNGVPLIRYHIADRGGLLSHDAMQNFIKDCGLASLESYGLSGYECHLPFAWVFGRADFTLSFYGANIFPENIAVGLEQPELTSWITGKFVMEVCNDADDSEFLQIWIELRPTISSDEYKRAVIAQSIHEQLLRLNSEFSNYVPEPRQIPKVKLLPFGEPNHFPQGVKHRYTRS